MSKIFTDLLDLQPCFYDIAGTSPDTNLFCPSFPDRLKCASYQYRSVLHCFCHPGSWKISGFEPRKLLAVSRRAANLASQPSEPTCLLFFSSCWSLSYVLCLFFSPLLITRMFISPELGTRDRIRLYWLGS